MSYKKYAAIPSFIKGVGSILDIKPFRLNEPVKRIFFRTDSEILSNDWKSIGKDFDSVLNNYGKTLKSNSKTK